MKEDQPVIEGTGFTMNPAVVDRPSSPEREGAGRVPSQLEPLFPRIETEAYRSDWHGIQGNFVDDPKRAVEQADKLVATTIQRLASQFTTQRKLLEEGWSKNGDASTEDLRQALRRYRAFFDRLLSL
jgi:hypothetical protein